MNTYKVDHLNITDKIASKIILSRIKFTGNIFQLLEPCSQIVIHGEIFQTLFNAFKSINKNVSVLILLNYYRRLMRNHFLVARSEESKMVHFHIVCIISNHQV